jgi:hypothetical protein
VDGGTLAAVRPLPVLVLCALAVSACSSSDSSKRTTSTTAKTTSMQAFVTAGNNVCMAADRRIVKLGRLTRSPSGWAKTAAEARRAIREMKNVTPPPMRAKAFQQMLRYAGGLALSIQEVHDALVKKDIDTAAAAQFAAATFQDRVHQAAKTAGLTFCQQPLTNWPA